MKWLTTNRLWIIFNLSAIFVLVFTIRQGEAGWNNTKSFDPGLENAKWAVRFLLICLSMTPLRTYFGWNASFKLRKSAGLWSFGFACVHVAYTLWQTGFNWLTLTQPLFVLGLASFGILSALALTSNRFAMRRLRKNWKKLHRMVYVAGGTILYHAILATLYSKKMYIRDPNAIHELRIYLAILTGLLVVRIPHVRRFIKGIRSQPRPTKLPQVEKPLLEVPIFMHPKSNGHPPIYHQDDLIAFAEEEGAEQLEKMPF